MLTAGNEGILAEHIAPREIRVEDRSMVMNLLVWALFGLIAGAIAQFLMPGRDPGQSANLRGFLITALLGILGAIAGGYISSLLFNWDVTGFNLSSLAIAVGGALLLLIVYRMMTGTRRLA